MAANPLDHEVRSNGRLVGWARRYASNSWDAWICSEDYEMRLGIYGSRRAAEDAIRATLAYDDDREAIAPGDGRYYHPAEGGGE